MKTSANNAGVCQVCQQHKPLSKLLPATAVRDNILNLIRKDFPQWDPDGAICFSCLNHYRTAYVRKLMEDDLGDLDAIEQEVVDSLQQNRLLSENLNEEYEKSLTFGDRVADKVAAFGGSWTFILWATIVLVIWIVLNSIILLANPFDPYPYILLNLFLSMLAALQAPVIMMSQNRQESRDRMRAENDYQVNLKAEMEIRVLNEKVDQLLHHQLQRFMKVQEIQVEMLNELHDRSD